MGYECRREGVRSDDKNLRGGKERRKIRGTTVVVSLTFVVNFVG